MWWKNCICQPAVGKQNATFSPDFTQPGKSLLEVPCITAVADNFCLNLPAAFTQPGDHLFSRALYNSLCDTRRARIDPSPLSVLPTDIFFLSVRRKSLRLQKSIWIELEPCLAMSVWLKVPVSSILQGCTKITFPSCVKFGEKVEFCLPSVGRRA